MAKVTQVDFPPRETVSYTKETQTPVMTQQKEGDSHMMLYRLTLKNGQNLCVQWNCVSEYVDVQLLC